MRSIRFFLLPLALSATTTAAVSAQTLGSYNVFSFGNFFQDSTETNARLAVGGDATLRKFAVGRLLTAPYTDYSLVVGGNLSAIEGQVYTGRTYVRGVLTDSINAGFPYSAPEHGGTSPIDFVGQTLRFRQLSAEYAAQQANATTQYYNGELQFLGQNQFNIYNISIDMLQAATGGYSFFNPAGTTNVVNIYGSSGNSAFTNNGYYFGCTDTTDRTSCVGGGQSLANEDTPEAAGLTLFNFYEQLALNIGGPVHGSILAPYADVQFGYGDVVGNVIVASGGGHAEFYENRDFSGELPDVETAPEPASLGLLATGLFGIAGVGVVRKRRVLAKI